MENEYEANWGIQNVTPKRSIDCRHHCLMTNSDISDICKTAASPEILCFEKTSLLY